MTTADNSWRQLTTADNSWQQLTTADDSWRQLMTADNSWQLNDNSQLLTLWRSNRNWERLRETAPFIAWFGLVWLVINQTKPNCTTADFCRTSEGLLKDSWRTSEGLLKDFWRTFEGLLKDSWRTSEGLLKDFRLYSLQNLFKSQPSGLRDLFTLPLT